MLEARGLTKYYGSVLAVQSIDFSLEPGQVLGYLGPNGSGKSTTVKMLIGLLEPTHGQVLFEGKNIQQDLVGYRKHLGYVPEEANLYPYLTGHEYLELVGSLRGMPQPRMKTKIDSLLELFSLFPHRHLSIGSYSKGMRQRILLISALMDNPDVLVLDEPLSGLDVTSALIFKNLIQSLSAKGKTIFYCSHVLEVVEKVCSRLLILRKGQVIASGTTQEVRQRIGETSLEQYFPQPCRRSRRRSNRQQHRRRGGCSVKASAKQFLRAAWETQSRRPLPLFCASSSAVFSTVAELPAQVEMNIALGVILILLALPGTLVSLLLFEKYGSLIRWMRGDGVFDPFTATIPDEYFFIVLSMVVTGAAAVWRWDALFLDRRDYSNIVPLPVSLRRIFLGNLVAILLLVAALTIDVNAASFLLFPVAVVGSQVSLGVFLQFAAGHAVTVILASAFSFFAVFAVIGLLMAILPYALFRRVSVYVRFLIALFFLALLTTSFCRDFIPRPGRPDEQARGQSSASRLVPRHRSNPLGQRPQSVFCGYDAHCASRAGNCCRGRHSVVYSRFRRSFVCIPETPELGPLPRSQFHLLPVSLFDRTILRDSPQRACFHFITRTLLRSEAHLQIASAFVAIGLVVSAQAFASVFRASTEASLRSPSEDLLSIPFT